MGGGSCFPWFTSALSSWSPSEVSSLKAGGLKGEVILRGNDAPYSWNFCGDGDAKALIPQGSRLGWDLEKVIARS